MSSPPRTPCPWVSPAGLQGWTCTPFIWVSRLMQRASHQIVTQCLFPQKTGEFSSNWADWKGCRLSPDPLGCVWGHVGHVCTLILVLVVVNYDLHHDGVCSLYSQASVLEHLPSQTIWFSIMLFMGKNILVVEQKFGSQPQNPSS